MSERVTEELPSCERSAPGHRPPPTLVAMPAQTSRSDECSRDEAPPTVVSAVIGGAPTPVQSPRHGSSCDDAELRKLRHEVATLRVQALRADELELELGEATRLLHSLEATLLVKQREVTSLSLALQTAYLTGGARKAPRPAPAGRTKGGAALVRSPNGFGRQKQLQLQAEMRTTEAARVHSMVQRYELVQVLSEPAVDSTPTPAAAAGGGSSSSTSASATSEGLVERAGERPSERPSEELRPRTQQPIIIRMRDRVFGLRELTKPGATLREQLVQVESLSARHEDRKAGAEQRAMTSTEGRGTVQRETKPRATPPPQEATTPHWQIISPPAVPPRPLSTRDSSTPHTNGRQAKLPRPRSAHAILRGTRGTADVVGAVPVGIDATRRRVLGTCSSAGLHSVPHAVPGSFTFRLQ